MRQIAFRGKCLKTGDWIYGGYAKNTVTEGSDMADVAIMPRGCYGVAVDPETVGQFTGLYDKKGRKIFEGDIVESKKLAPDAVCYDEFQGCYRLGEDSVESYMSSSMMFELTVIGNIHENADLLDV